METLLNSIIAGISSGAVISVILGGLFHRARTRITNEVKTEFDKIKTVFKSKREWQEKSLSDLLGPVVMHLQRTSRVGKRYRETTYKEKGKSYSDAMLMKESNEAVRSILLSNGHLLPETLRSHADDLVAHYDLWERRFEAKFEEKKPTADSVFDIGFTEEVFPKDAVKAFQDSYEHLRKELYGVDRTR